MQEDKMRALLVRAKARRFAGEVKESNMAMTVYDSIAEWLQPSEIQTFKDYLKEFGLRQRDDFKFEEDK